MSRSSKQAISLYLKSHRSSEKSLQNKPALTKTLASSRVHHTSHEQKRIHKKKTTYRPTGHFNSLPDEILLNVFMYLLPSDILACAQVCRRWNAISKDSLLWQEIFKKYAILRRNVRPPQDGDWKKVCILQCLKSRDEKIQSMMKKMDNYTGLQANTENILRTAGIGFLISFVDTDGRETCMREKDIFYFRMSLCARWYGISLPAAHRIKKIKMYAVNPVFFDSSRQAISNSPAKRSLLLEEPFKWAEWTRQALVTTDMLDIFILPFGLLVATWKDGKDIAFMTMNLHAHGIIDKCLLGTSRSIYQGTVHTVYQDDVDNRYGLHGYTTTIELRNMRKSFWSQQFRNIYARKEFYDGTARLTLLNPENDYDRSSVDNKISFMWKTDAFNGTVENMCFLDMTMLDDQDEPMWCIASPVQLIQPDLQAVNYNFSGQHYSITYADENGKVLMHLIWESAEKKYYVVGLEIFMNLQHINLWFGTKY